MDDCRNTAELNFVYEDADAFTNEISELYSYTERPEFDINLREFEDQMGTHGFDTNWKVLSLAQRQSVVMKLLDQLEVSRKPMRMRAARCILYIAQGCWAEMHSLEEQQRWTVNNVMLLYDMGVFHAFTDLLNIEYESANLPSGKQVHQAFMKPDTTIADSQDLRVILSVLYTITEVMRYEDSLESTEFKAQIEAFTKEIAIQSADELLIIKLLEMATQYCSGAAPRFPLKKIVLLIWKLILMSMGGMKALQRLKAEKRNRAGLPPQDEDTLDIIKNMKLIPRILTPTERLLEMLRAKSPKEPPRQPIETPSLPVDRSLPWKPKVTQKEFDSFLENVRMKAIGCKIQGYSDDLVGLPQPTCEAVKTLNELLYISLADVQIRNEEAIVNNSSSNTKEDIEDTPAEFLYQAMLPNAYRYIKALVKILMAAAPIAPSKENMVDVLGDILPEEVPVSVLDTTIMEIDVIRHQEIIVKAASAILLLLLKHFKLNHIYQFEYISQYLLFANCSPLSRFIKQNTENFVLAKNTISALEFPSCVVGVQEKLTEENLIIGGAAPYSWRNMFSCINVLRIVNKLTKGKSSRVAVFVAIDYAAHLERVLRVRHAMVQLYALKLLKMLVKYLSKPWRKYNAHVMNAIYYKVRHRFNDDWAFANVAPWTYKEKDADLGDAIETFNHRRYHENLKELNPEPEAECMGAVLMKPYRLPDDFKNQYDLWLEENVFNALTNWDSSPGFIG